MVRFLFSQDINIFFIWLILPSQFNSSHLSISWPNYIPNAFIGLLSHFMPSILSLHFFYFPTHIPCVLFLFNTKPDNDPKISISFRADAISSFELINRVVSSASCKIFVLWFFSSILIAIHFMFVLLCSLKAMISTDNMNNKANKGHICRIHLKFLKIINTHPLFDTQVWISEYKVWTQRINKWLLSQNVSMYLT